MVVTMSGRLDAAAARHVHPPLDNHTELMGNRSSATLRHRRPDRWRRRSCRTFIFLLAGGSFIEIPPAK